MDISISSLRFGLGDCWSEVRRDAAFYVFVLIYFLLGLLTAELAGAPQKFFPFAYAWALLPPFGIALVLVAGACSLRSGEPLTFLRQSGHSGLSSKGVAMILLVLALSLHGGVFTSVKTMLTDIVPFYADTALADFDEKIHGGAAPWQYTTELIPAKFTSALWMIYHGAWATLMYCTLISVVMLPTLRHVREQFLWVHLIMWPLLGNVIAGFFMSAGPLYYELVTGDSARFAGLTYFLDQSLPPIATEVIQSLWQSHADGKAMTAGGISAFPSLHLATATSFTLLASKINRKLTLASGIFCATIFVLSIHLGWHYAIDGYFSILATILIWIAVGSALTTLRQPRV